ncbi:MAG: hypothetical protein ACLQVX_08250 [Limisphaerales bacterium]
MSTSRILRVSALSLPFLAPNALLACAACYGQSDSPLAHGMNWGIASLLGTILLVLGGVAAFFVGLARRSAALSRAAAPGTTGTPDTRQLTPFRPSARQPA